jgi:hypothetical protein
MGGGVSRIAAAVGSFDLWESRADDPTRSRLGLAEEDPMSSTHRGATRRPADYYPTPQWCTRRLLEALELPAGRWLEPGAGEGHIIRAVDEARGDVEWTACELRAECRESLRVLVPEVRCPHDFVEHRAPASGFDVVICNPPFSLACEFVERSLPLGEWVVMFLRLNFLGSARRNSFFRARMPDVYVVPDRPSFTADGKTDSVEYAWFVWPPHHRRTTGRVSVLRTTPLEQRRLRE